MIKLQYVGFGLPVLIKNQNEGFINCTKAKFRSCTMEMDEARTYVRISWPGGEIEVPYSSNITCLMPLEVKEKKVEKSPEVIKKRPGRRPKYLEENNASV